MKIKTIIVGMLAACCFPVAAIAESMPQAKLQPDNDISNSLAISYDATDLEFQKQPTSEPEVAQRTRRTRRSSRSDLGIYFGGNLGLFVPKGAGNDVAFGLGGFVGYKISPNLGGDGEFFIAFNGDGLVLAFMANPRLEFELKDSSMTAFFSPGVGIGIIDPDQGDSDTDLSFQLKTGLTIPVGNNKAFGQFRVFSQKDFSEIYSIEGGMIF